MVLVNGADGIGTGWSTSIPNFNPRDLISNIKRKLNGEEIEKMHPHYFGFGGTIEQDATKNGSYIVSGKIERVDDETLHISELPIKSWTQDYKSFLEKMMLGDDKKKLESEIKDFKENHTDTTVSFTITAKKELIDKFEKDKDGLEGKFKLRSRINTTNMNVFDKHGRIVKFNSPEALMDSFFHVRLHYYGLRKEHLLEEMRREKRMLSNKARFVEEVCSGALVVSNRKRKDILNELKENGYEIFAKKTNKMRPNQESESEEDDENDNESDSDLAKGYEYLLGMKIWSLTYEKAERLRQELAEKSKAVADLEATSPEQLWMNDLKDLEEALDDRDEAYAAAAAEEVKAQGKNNKRRAMKKKKTTTKRKPKQADDSDEDFELPKKKKTTKSAAASKKPKTKQTTLKQTTLTKTIEIDSDSRLTFTSSNDSDEKLLSSSSSLSSDKSKSNPIDRDLGISKASSLSSNSDSDSDLEFESSLRDRFNKKKKLASKVTIAATKPPVKSKAATKKKTSGKKRSSPKSSAEKDEGFDSFDTSSYEPAALTPAPKRKKVSKKAPIEIDSDEDDIFDEMSGKSESSGSKASEAAAAPKPRSRPTRGRKKITYVVDSDDDNDGSDDEFDFDE